jgi:hypothetical protein
VPRGKHPRNQRVHPIANHALKFKWGQGCAPGLPKHAVCRVQKVTSAVNQRSIEIEYYRCNLQP